MKKLLFFAIVMAVLAAAHVASAGTLYTHQAITHDGGTRYFHYYVPSGFTGDLPLVFALHGNGGSADEVAGLTSAKAPLSVWMDVADDEGIIICYPDGAVGSDNDQGWNDCRDNESNPTTDDVDFIETLISWFDTNENIDTNKVYSSGMSNGAHMSLRLAIESSANFAAVAGVAAALPVASEDECSSASGAVAVGLMNGTSDPIMPYNGGEMSNGGNGTVQSTEDSIDFWVDHNNCSTTAATRAYTNISTADGNTTVTSYTYSGGDSGTQVVLWRVNNGGHAEPSIAEQFSFIWELFVGRQNHDIEMVVEIWDFFSGQSL